MTTNGTTWQPNAPRGIETQPANKKMTGGDRQRQIETNNISDWHPCGQVCDVLSVPLANQVYRLTGSQQRQWSHRCVEVWPQGGHRKQKGRSGAPKSSKRCQKVPIWSSPGGPNPQNMVFYHEKTLIFTKATNPNF